MTDAGLALVAALANRGDRSMICLCLAYAAARIAFILVAPSPAAAGPAWYFICASAEMAIVAVAIATAAPAGRVVAKFSIFGILAHSLTGLEYLFMPTTVLYSAYPWIINSLEAAQVASLFLLSPPARLALGSFLGRFRPPRHHEDNPCRRAILKFG